MLAGKANMICRDMNTFTERLRSFWMPNRSLYLQWLVTSISAWMLAWLVSGSIERPVISLNFHPSSDFRLMLINSLAIGALLGTLQWIVLRRFFPGIRAWIPSSMLGILLANVGMYGLLTAWEVLSLSRGASDLLNAVRFVLAWGVFGAILASSQWLALRKHIRGAHRWILANTVGAALGLSLLPIVALLIPGRPAFDLHEDLYLHIMFVITPTTSQALLAGLALSVAWKDWKLDLNAVSKTAS
jgi:hypothetical protein